MNKPSEGLSGAWEGQYRYPWGETVSFLARLDDTLGSLSGNTVETEAGSMTFRAAKIDGGHSSGHLSFIKTYEVRCVRFRSPVHYRGVASADGKTITGSWSVSGVTGSFEMHREGEAEEEEGEIVGAVIALGVELVR